MNYLAHFHLCHDSPQQTLGSFLGDFVKGQTHRDYPQDISTAILLHRHIDSFTDRHPLVQTSRSRLEGPYRRYAGIVVDMLFDYFLSQHWRHFSDAEAPDFIQSIYAQLLEGAPLCPERAQAVIQHMCSMTG